jgi:hypothetical protein
MKQLICFWGLVLSSTQLSAQWIQTNGPYGGYVSCFAVSGTNLFAGTTGSGVFLSTNNGIGWTATNVGLLDENVSTLAVSEANLFAGTDGGVFRSTNNGESWTPVNVGLLDANVYALAVSGANLFAGTFGGTHGGGVFLSTNNGESWTGVYAGLPIGGSVISLAVSGTNLFAGTNISGVFLSTNNGTSWSPTGSMSTKAYDLAVSGANLFAATNGGVYLSTNNGTSWTPVDSGLTNLMVRALAVSGPNLFAGTYYGGVFLSTNSGTSWTAVNSGLTSMQILSFAVSGTNLFAGTNGAGVFLSTNNGTSWAEVNTGLTNTVVQAFAVSGTNLFAGTLGGGVFLSTNTGSGWIALNMGLTNNYVWTLAVNGTHLFAGTNGSGVFSSTNNGTSWTQTSLIATVKALAVNSTHLFAGTNGSGVFSSTNNGTSWTQTSLIAYVRALAVSGSNLFAGTSGGVFLSTNNGTSWTERDSGLTNTYVSSLAASGTNLYAGTESGGVFRSTDNGIRWTEANAGLTNTSVLALAVSGTNLFAGTTGGVFLSTNDGTSWTAAGSGLTNLYINSLAASTNGTGGMNLFAGTWGSGVWRLPLSVANGQFTQQGSKLVGTGGSGARQGISVSTSSDGNTAIVGGYYDNSFAGAAWVYTRTGGVWSQQGSKLVGTGAVGSLVYQGVSVSISSDGNTAIVGGYGDNSGLGATWVYTRTGGVWSQQGSKLVGTGAIGIARQGISVSISSDGNTAIVGGYYDNSSAGAAWVYTRTGGVWSQQGSKLVGTGAVGSLVYQGVFVSISSDGNTAIVGGYYDNSSAGAAWVYTRTGGVWSQQGSKLIGTGAVGSANQGFGVAISSDGNTAIVGGYGDNSGLGAAWVYTRTGGVWSQQGSKLVGTGAVGSAGQGLVSISSDGNTAIVGGYFDNSNAGAAWVFTRSGGVWSQQGSKLVGTGAVGSANQGFGVAISSDGNTAIVGGFSDNNQAGAAWVYARSSSSVGGLSGGTPSQFVLTQNYPNPFNPTTTIEFSLPKTGNVTLKVFDVLGREVATLVDENLPVGVHKAEWNAGGLASGMYFYRLQAGEFVRTKALMLLK